MSEIVLPNEEIERISKLPFALPERLRAILKGFMFANRKKNTSAVMLIDGRSGMGKTTLSFQIGCYCDVNFSLDNVYFNPDDFLSGLANAKPYSVHIFDEAMLLSNRSSMSSINRMAIQAMSMIRSKKIIVIFNVNSIFDLDKNLVLSRADIALNVYGESLTDRGRFMAFFKGEDGLDRLKMLYLIGKKFYDYSKPKSNFNSTFCSYFPFNEDEYECRKQKGVNDFLLKGQKAKSDKTRKSRDALIIWVVQNTNLSTNEIADITQLTPRAIQLIKKDYGVKDADN